MGKPATPPLALPQAVQDELVERLEACHALQDASWRRDVVGRLDSDIGTRIDDHSAMRPHLSEMVKNCAAFPDGLRQHRGALVRRRDERHGRGGRAARAPGHRARW